MLSKSRHWQDWTHQFLCSCLQWFTEQDFFDLVLFYVHHKYGRPLWPSTSDDTWNTHLERTNVAIFHDLLFNEFWERSHCFLRDLLKVTLCICFQNYYGGIPFNTQDFTNFSTYCMSFLSLATQICNRTGNLQ